jgi:hypothetical protein
MSIGALRERLATPPLLPAAGTREGLRKTPEPSRDAEPSGFAATLHGLAQEVQRGESLMRDALGAGHAGRVIGTADLIALQAGVYRYGEAVDLASRLVDRATSSVKTILEGQ